MTRLFFAFVLSLSLFPLSAQFSIHGAISDEQGPMFYCTFQISTLDSVFVKGGVSDEFGRFSTQLERGDYQLEISYIGYKSVTKVLKVEGDVDLGTIQMAVLTNELEEVVVSAQKQLVERKSDRLVFNMAKSIAAQGSDLATALKLAPGIMINNETIAMVGRGEVRVLINDRPLQLSGEELLAYLSAISADDIEKIEIINNPPARYEASGNAGLINIIYKKGRKNSWKNTSNLSYEKNKYGYATFGNTFHFNKNKTSLSLSLNRHKGSRWEKELAKTEFLTGNWEWEANTEAKRDDASERLALDYQLTDRISIGAQYMGTLAKPDLLGMVENKAFNVAGDLDSLLSNNSSSDRSRNTNGLNLHWTAQLDSLGRKLSFDADYFDFQNATSNDYQIETYNAQEEFLGIHRSRLNLSSQQIKNYSIKADMEHPTDWMNLSYGARYSKVKTGNQLEDFNTITGVQILDVNLSNEFDYEENILALYLSGSKRFNQQWNAKLGIRLEQTQTRGFSKTLNQSNENQYTKLFPTAYLNYVPHQDHNFSTSMGVRINRPGFRDLNPFRIYLTNSSYSEGNPFLQASFTNTYTFNYVFKGKYTTHAFVNHTTSGFGTIFAAEEQSQTQSIIRANFYNSVNKGIGEIFSLGAGRWLNSQNQVFLIHSETAVLEEYSIAPKNGFHLYLSSSNTINLKNNWSTQINFWYSSAHNSNVFEMGEVYSLDLAVKKSLWNKKLQISIQASDVLNTASQLHLRSEFAGIPNTYGSNYSSRNIRFSLSYAFGNDKIRVGDRGFGNQEEVDRL